MQICIHIYHSIYTINSNSTIIRLWAQQRRREICIRDVHCAATPHKTGQQLFKKSSFKRPVSASTVHHASTRFLNEVNETLAPHWRLPKLNRRHDTNPSLNSPRRNEKHKKEMKNLKNWAPLQKVTMVTYWRRWQDVTSQDASSKHKHTLLVSDRWIIKTVPRFNNQLGEVLCVKT